MKEGEVKHKSNTIQNQTPPFHLLRFVPQSINKRAHLLLYFIVNIFWCLKIEIKIVECVRLMGCERERRRGSKDKSKGNKDTSQG